MKEEIINAYITDPCLLQEKREMKSEMKKNVIEEYKQGLITEEQKNQKLLNIEALAENPLKKVVNKDGNIITGFKKSEAHIPYDELLFEDYTKEYSSKIYKDVFRRKTQSEIAFLNLLENDIVLYVETGDEEILNKYSERIIEAVKNLIEIGADYTEIHEHLVENGIFISDEALKTRGR